MNKPIIFSGHGSRTAIQANAPMISKGLITHPGTRQKYVSFLAVIYSLLMK
jgi:hypothetical protein